MSLIILPIAAAVTGTIAWWYRSPGVEVKTPVIATAAPQVRQINLMEQIRTVKLNLRHVTVGTRPAYGANSLENCMETLRDKMSARREVIVGKKN